MFSPQQQKIVDLMARGLSHKEICSAMGMKDSTVYNHVFTINQKAKKAGFRWGRVLVKKEQNAIDSGLQSANIAGLSKQELLVEKIKLTIKRPQK